MSSEDAAVVRYLHEAGHLKNTPRAGWLLTGVKSPESVAEHSYRVAVIAYVLATMEGADADRAAALAVFHDVPEARTTDLHSVAKRHVGGPADVEVAAVQLAGVPEQVAAPVCALIAEFAARETAEAWCAKDADKIECLLQAREYVAQGNLLAQPWVDSMLGAVKTESGRRLAHVAVKVSPDEWWHEIVSSYGRPTD